MLVFIPPDGQIGSLLAALHEARALVQALESNEAQDHLFGENLEVMAGLLQRLQTAPASNRVTVNVFFQDGRLTITADENGITPQPDFVLMADF